MSSTPALTLPGQTPSVSAGAPPSAVDFRPRGDQRGEPDPLTMTDGLLARREARAEHAADGSASARRLLTALRPRLARDLAVTAGIGLVPFAPPHILARAAFEARAIAIRACCDWYLETARDAFAVAYALKSLRFAALGDPEEAERFLGYATERAGVAS